MLAKDKALEVKEPNPMKKAMMWGSIKMNTLTDNSRSHIADMMIQGNTKGSVELMKAVKSNQSVQKEYYEIAQELMDFEEKNIEKLKAYLR